MSRWEEMWCFETPNVRVVAEITPDDDFECSWADEETLAAISDGTLSVFGTRVRVFKAGVLVGEDSLWGSVYKRPSEFFTDHRDSDPMNRNCEPMRAAKGNNVVICHYFPDMVRTALANARENLAKLCA